MKILNLYCGIGGNRKLWGDNHSIVAVELDIAVAKAYKDRYPKDTIVIADAKQYLLDHYKEFDFIWVSPPCQTHSVIINSQYTRSTYIPKYPDMTLYQIISFLKRHGNQCLWVVENVKPYYEPWLQPSVSIDRHLYWSNFDIKEIEVEKQYLLKDITIESLTDFNIKGYKDIKNKRQVIRNQVNYRVGKHILDSAFAIWEL